MNDPMSELLKIEPSSLGVGMYQKDISASDIKALAEEVADSCVHFAGVDANTAGAHLLQVCFCCWWIPLRMPASLFLIRVATILPHEIIVF
jgi:hypothetical protein